MEPAVFYADIRAEFKEPRHPAGKARNPARPHHTQGISTSMKSLVSSSVRQTVAHKNILKSKGHQGERLGPKELSCRGCGAAFHTREGEAQLLN